jgi:hypothetical protein
MPDEPRKPQEWEAQVIQRLVKEIGITAEEARELISVLGHCPSSGNLRQLAL